MLKTALKRAGVGFLAGMVAGALMVVIEGYAYSNGSLVLPDRLVAWTGSEAGALLAQMLASGAFGAIPMAGTVLYDIDSWSMLKQALVHFLSYTVAFILIGCSIGWISPSLADVGAVALAFAICHLAIWLIMYARYKSQVRELNELLLETQRDHQKRHMRG